MSRDMTKAAFEKALKKYHFKKIAMWIHIDPQNSIGCTYYYDRQNKLKLNRRHTLKTAIAEKTKIGGVITT